MQASCDVAYDYAHTREQFGQKIGTFQVLGFYKPFILQSNCLLQKFSTGKNVEFFCYNCP